MPDIITKIPRIFVACGIPGAQPPTAIGSCNCNILVFQVPTDLPNSRLLSCLTMTDADVLQVHDYCEVPRNEVRQKLLSLAAKAARRQSAPTLVVRCGMSQLDLIMDACLWCLESQIPAPVRRVSSAKIAYFSALLGWYAPSLRNLARRLFWVLRRMK